MAGLPNSRTSLFFTSFPSTSTHHNLIGLNIPCTVVLTLGLALGLSLYIRQTRGSPLTETSVKPTKGQPNLSSIIHQHFPRHNKLDLCLACMVLATPSKTATAYLSHNLWINWSQCLPFLPTTISHQNSLRLRKMTVIMTMDAK